MDRSFEIYKMRLRIFVLITNILLFNSFKLFSQSVTDDQIKSGYVYSFLKYFTWQKETDFDTFNVAVYSEDQDFFKVLQSMEKLEAKGKHIRVVNCHSITELPYCQILIIGNEHNYQIKEIYDQIRGDNILFVTDNCNYKRYVMINFIYNENSKIQFEINSRNLEESNLKSSPKLILLGGNEIDVRNLYIETEKSLKTEKQKVETFEKELIQKQEEIRQINSKLELLYTEINKLQDNIQIQKGKLLSLQHQTENQLDTLRVKTQLLNQQKIAIYTQERRLSERNAELEKRKNQIEDYSKILESQKLEIANRQEVIGEQEEKISNQIGKIKTQQTFLYLLISLSLMTISFFIVIYRNFKINKKRNLELEKANSELNIRKNEIFEQALQLEIKNFELEKLSAVVRETDNAVIIMNEKADFEWVNEGFSRLYGFSLEQYISVKGANLKESSNLPGIGEVLDYVAKVKKSTSYESYAIDKEGKKIWVHSTLTPILDVGRNIKKLIVIDSDITALKEAEFEIIEKNNEIQRQSEELYKQAENLIHLNHELELKKDTLEDALQKLKNTQTQLVESEKMVILGQLTAGIAHEINNPISYINSGIEGLKIAINQLVELLNKYAEITPENAKIQLNQILAYKQEIEYDTLLSDIQQLAQDIKSGVKRTIEIIKGLRTFSRLDESDLKFIDLHQNIESTLVILRNKYNNRIHIERKFDNIPPIECYPGKINQVLLNILVNAIQAIPGEGRISIITQLIENDNGQNVRIDIKDTGSGMSEEIKHKIFEPFFTTKEAGEGTGLGLSISHNIIEAHHGSITVESKIDEGSTFTIILPVEFKKKNKLISIEQ